MDFSRTRLTNVSDSGSVAYTHSHGLTTLRGANIVGSISPYHESALMRLGQIMNSLCKPINTLKKKKTYLGRYLPPLPNKRISDRAKSGKLQKPSSSWPKTLRRQQSKSVRSCLPFLSPFARQLGRRSHSSCSPRRRRRQILCRSSRSYSCSEPWSGSTRNQRPTPPLPPLPAQVLHPLLARFTVPCRPLSSACPHRRTPSPTQRRSSPSVASLCPPPAPAPLPILLASRGSASGSSSSLFHQISPSPGTAAKRRPRPSSRLTHSLPLGA